MTSRIPGFHRLSVEERIARLADLADLSTEELALLGRSDALGMATADMMVENVIGVFGLPIGLAANFQINGRDLLVPMVVEEPSVVAAASNAARVMRDGGGIQTEATPSWMIGQIQIIDVPEPFEAAERVLDQSAELISFARELQPRMVARGGGASELECEVLGEDSLLVHVHADVGDAMGANAINTLMEALAPRIVEIVGGEVNLRILSNLSDRRLVRASVRIPHAALAAGDRPGSEVARRIGRASEFAERSPHRATTHNKGVMNGVDAVALAAGQDWRAIEAGAHAFAARSGSYQPLALWSDEGDALVGRLELPLAIGTVGERIRINPLARLSLRVMRIESAGELGQVMAAVGLAQNFAALRALATEGIQKGHMRLHNRTIHSESKSDGAAAT